MNGEEERKGEGNGVVVVSMVLLVMMKRKDGGEVKVRGAAICLVESRVSA